jgi:hypothetical protein
MKSFSFSISLKSRSTMSRWQRISFFSNSVDLNRDLDQLRLPLVPETFREQIQRSLPNLSSALGPPSINPLANPYSNPHSASFKFARRTLDSTSNPQLLKLRMAESSNPNAAVFGLEVKLRPLLNSWSGLF